MITVEEEDGEPVQRDQLEREECDVFVWEREEKWCVCVCVCVCVCTHTRMHVCVCV